MNNCSPENYLQSRQFQRQGIEIDVKRKARSPTRAAALNLAFVPYRGFHFTRTHTQTNIHIHTLTVRGTVDFMLMIGRKLFAASRKIYGIHKSRAIVYVAAASTKRAFSQPLPNPCSMETRGSQTCYSTAWGSNNWRAPSQRSTTPGQKYYLSRNDARCVTLVSIEHFFFLFFFLPCVQFSKLSRLSSLLSRRTSDRRDLPATV